MENKQFIPDQIQKIKKEIFPIQLPVFDRHGDQISFYAEQLMNGFLLSDDGYLIRDLLSSGLTLEEIQEELKKRLNNTGIFVDGYEMKTMVNQEQFVPAINEMTQVFLDMEKLFFNSEQKRKMEYESGKSRTP